MSNASIMFPGLRANRPVDLPGEPRTFTGNGLGMLAVPGCLAVAMILINGHELQPLLTQEFPTDLEAKKHVSQTVPLYDLVKNDEGVPAIVRHYQSNDGIWQEGATIMVVGKWEVPPEPEQPPSDHSVPNNPSPDGTTENAGADTGKGKK